ncbi:unnamed protein product [Paramecium pentaurelia]|uniref:Uncharacterized protein n=1 Tax=Paramecium pentaurelia TaxID=43138 RepID=A0A8S1XB15_9CILI|nr:unnamed protein product [Paramecium pentaurelia]
MQGYYQSRGPVQQQQIYEQQSFKEEQALIQYYVYQDLQNFINLLYSMKAIQQYFANEPNHPAITLSINKVILQLNISNSIHYDLDKEHKGIQAQHCIIEERYKVQNMLKSFYNEFGQGQQQLINNYIQNSLQQKVSIKQLALQQTQDFVFNQNLLNQLIPQVEVIEQQIQHIKQAKYYRIPDQQEIKNKAIDFQNQTKYKLQNIYPKTTQFNPTDVRVTQNMQQNGGSLIQNYNNIGDPNLTASGKSNNQTYQKQY